jgi:hypothetical protein
VHDRGYRLLGPHGVHGRRRFRDWALASSRAGPPASMGCPDLRCPMI